MASNTTRTILGFLRSVIERRTPFGRTTDSVEQIYNYVDIDGLFATSGQPSEAQFELIRDAGFETVINLAPTRALENSLQNEDQVLARLGIDYVHIPVAFDNPTEDDFARFRQALDAHRNSRVWVHCAANMRVSAFTYRYRRTVLGDHDADARADLQRIWEPFGVWREFITRPDQPARERTRATPDADGDGID